MVSSDWHACIITGALHRAVNLILIFFLIYEIMMRVALLFLTKYIIRMYIEICIILWYNNGVVM